MKTPPKFDPWAVLHCDAMEGAKFANHAKPITGLEGTNTSNDSGYGLQSSGQSQSAIIVDFVAEYEERAAIREYDGGQIRSDAELLALTECAPDPEKQKLLLDAAVMSSKPPPKETSE